MHRETVMSKASSWHCWDWAMADQPLGPCSLLAYQDPWCCVEASYHHRSSEGRAPSVPCPEGHSFSALAPGWDVLVVVWGPCSAAWGEDRVLRLAADWPS